MNGSFSSNLGRTQFVGITAGVTTCTKSGHSVVFDRDGGDIENKATSKIIWLEEDGHLWALRIRELLEGKPCPSNI